MANLAIKGHSTRGDEVIALLKMLGGINERFKFDGLNEEFIYYICPEYNNDIHSAIIPTDQIVFTLEEFLEKFPYKVGDKVWLHYENSTIKVTETITCMRWCDKCHCVLYDVYTCCNLRGYAFTPYKEETMEEDKAMAPNLVGEDYSGKRFGYKIPQGYEFDCIQNNEIIIKPTKPKYPKTYKECCDVLGLNTMDNDAQGYEADLIIRFQELLIARGAYWKQAGEQMGLGKPWEPDFGNENEYKYGLFRLRNIIYKDASCINPTLLIFPTAEMRDAFYENFKVLIETCKELL